MKDMHQVMVNQLAEIESKVFAISAYKSYLGIKYYCLSQHLFSSEEVRIKIVITNVCQI